MINRIDSMSQSNHSKDIARLPNATVGGERLSIDHLLIGWQWVVFESLSSTIACQRCNISHTCQKRSMDNSKLFWWPDCEISSKQTSGHAISSRHVKQDLIITTKRTHTHKTRRACSGYHHHISLKKRYTKGLVAFAIHTQRANLDCRQVHISFAEKGRSTDC